ncbi:hypothetical protein ACHAPT_006677 [Fusarium lateritium]
MKLSSGLALLLIGIAQALPLSEARKSHVSEVQNNARLKLAKRIYHWASIPLPDQYDDAILEAFKSMGQNLQAITRKKPALSSWDDKENNRYQSNSWGLTDYETLLLDKLVEDTGWPA